MHQHPTATLWLFAYSGVTVATHAAIVRDLRGWPNLQHWALGEESLISRGRSRVATQFLQTPREIAGDVLLFVDHDIAWQEGDLSYLARRALERNAVVGGIYPKRTFGDGSAIRFAAQGEWQIGQDALIPVTYLGSGFLAIPRGVLEALVPTLPWIEEGYWPFFLPLTVETTADGKTGWEYLSEDWAFCERVRQTGGALFAACYPRLTHEGRYTYRLVDAKARPPKDEDIPIRLGEASFSGRTA